MSLQLKLTAAFQAIGDDIQTLLSHVSNMANPHGVDKTDVGLGNVDNTSDVNKPVSNATQSALNDKQDILLEGAFADGDKTKLDGIEAGAEVNVQSDWNSVAGDSLILNKPSTVSDAAYGAGWNGDTDAPSKNAVYDKIESLTSALPGFQGIKTASFGPTTTYADITAYNAANTEEDTGFSFNETTGVLTVTDAGTYSVSAQVAYTSDVGTGQNDGYIRLVHEGTSLTYSESTDSGYRFVAGMPFNITLSNYRVVTTTASEELKLEIKEGASSGGITVDFVRFSVERLS